MLPKIYEPQKYEADIYKQWEDAGAFKPSGSGKPFAIIMPPPNANGALHWGHAIGYSLTDVITRYSRMSGKRTLWQPGTDHAGIETQFVYERDVLKPQGKSRLDFTPKQFYEDVMKFTLAQQDTVLNQFRSMGFSADWSKLKFTLDEDIIKIVYDTFKQMHDDGHIYRGPRIVNWCPRCQAAFADIEIDRQEQEDPFYILQYGPFRIGTARPETKFGDKYVVMHPGDERYKKYKNGDLFEAEWINGKIKATVIKDSVVDPKFGTGVMTITPWHDPIDFELAERHNLEKEQIIDFNGNLLPIAEEFAGLPIEKAREKIVNKLREKGLLVKIDKRIHAIGIHDRCGTTIEPQVSTQWFLRIKDLNQPVINALKNERISLFPKRFNKVALNWLEQEHDWCISRDSCWWGIRMPIYYNNSQDKTKKPYLVTEIEQDAIEYYGEGRYLAETATFDTWFSSGQWPYATLMANGDFDEYYPTDLMGTAREILHKWVTRMVMFSLYKTDEIPFKDVYLWGLVTDEHGKKMSKSKGNVVDPMAITAKYGTDALRLAGAISNTPGTDSPMSEGLVMGMRNFNNKLWNVARFVLTKIDGVKSSNPNANSLPDEWIIERLNQGIEDITRKIKGYRLNEASNTMYHLLWDDFADWYLEASKLTKNPQLLLYGLETILKLAHPFVPFVTEAIWSQLPNRNSLLISAPWPTTIKRHRESIKKFEQLQLIISEIRTLRSELSLSDLSLYFHKSELLENNKELIVKLAGIRVCEKVENGTGLPLSSTAIDCWLGVDHDTIIEYKVTLDAKYADIKAYLSKLDSQLKNQSFIKSAPKEIVERTKDQKTETQSRLDLLKSQLDNLNKVL